MPPKKTIISLDIARGIAALLVFISHIRAYLFLDFGQLEHKSALARAFYFITSLGHESVMIFFVLSGFLVAGSVYKSFEKENFTWKIYLTNRLTRLYVVCIPALLLTLFWDKLGIYITNSPYYQGGFGETLAIAPDEPVSHSLSVFLQNLGFLQTITCPVYGTNGAMWSLANEFWYYIAFPFLMLAFVGITRKQFGKAAYSVLLSVAFLVFFPSNIVLGFGVWLFGFVAYRLTLNVKLITLLNATWVRLLTLCLLCGGILFSATPGVNEWIADYTVGIIYTLVLLSFLNFDMRESFLRKVVEFFSNISYTLYLVHMPLIVFTICYFFNNERYGFEMKPVLIFLAYFVGVIIYSYIMYALFEKRTPIVRDWVLKKIGNR